MNFLFNKYSHFNLANIVTFFNISCGIIAIYFLTHNEFIGAALFAWLAGAFDIFDGKIARKYNLSTEFGIQLDSYADFLSFVIVPAMFIYFAIFDGKEEQFNMALLAGVFIYYIICGLRRLIQFNINSEEGEVERYFIGVPTPLGAILLWIVYLIFLTGFINEYIVLFLMVVIGYLLNSKIKIKHL
ncbi:CDP-alcohol phosphatidyltransferase family protein [Aliarcobacter skirrowii]|uniref:CDP-alcohol phosphatidyltransferase family protein n=1 Tax=Aliarcobacter TaxID=2321111 RepID=UPI00243270D0|nr:CDP-alcohol phosphatidyltransferase family protein [Aliarcobacter skirrowii]MDD2508768.1 CDP-alcohol phosphatidyltransferase family protein [Aliarcobacter skirrowii]MDD3497386.1 CDP-alcohol phosphatidyltransferase family protein [Aliarcobacter skirrowii]MDX4012278.1 CDP-alcohol phosphatidyltransferase family protein [Aliarcobacter skirrowii]MDX4026010.1 CDP-alcohol phosphatidyltransferase family protein [Aliarcobacter skirrowii]MDX4048526.1 CDP-alcohol phosphatidyltransferase family protein